MRKYLLFVLLFCPVLAFGQYGGDKSNTIPAGGGTFSLVQGPDTANCSFSSSATCSFTGIAVTSGDAVLVGCVSQDTTGGIYVPPPVITSTNFGTPTTALGASTGTYGTSGPANSRASYVYVLPGNNTGHAAPATVTLQESSNFTSYCGLAEWTPSANPSQVGLDIDGAVQPAANCTSCTAATVTFGGTNQISLAGQMGTSAFNLYPTAITSPFSSHKYFSSSGLSAGFAAAAPSNGTQPTWTQPSGIPLLSNVSLSYSPASCAEQSFFDFEDSTDGSGNAVTVAGLASTGHGWQGGLWTVTGTIKVSTTNMGLQNTGPRLCGDGYTPSAGAGSYGLSWTGGGSATNYGVSYVLGYTNISAMNAGIWFCSDATGSLNASLDIFAIHGITGAGASDFVNVELIGDGTNTHFALETQSGTPGSNSISYTAGTGCGAGGTGWKYLLDQYNSQGAMTITVYNTGGTSDGTLTYNSTVGASKVTSIYLFATSSQNLPNGKHIYLDSLQFNLANAAMTQ